MNRSTRFLTAAELELAKRLLDDGASCSEVARSIGCATKAISRRWPERKWSQSQGGRLGALISHTNRN